MTRIGFGISGGLRPSEIVECAVLAEDLGYESVWVAEGHGGDQFAVLAACAQVTSRILLGTSSSSVFVRTVPTLAMAAATVDDLSNHRLILGLGSSHKVQVEPEHALLPCSVNPDRRLALDIMRPGVALYAGFFPRYNRLMAESGFPAAAQVIRDAWARGDQETAIQAVPDELIDEMGVVGVVGAPEYCRERLAAYRESGIDLPIISPFSRGPGGKERVMAAIRACAP